MLSQTSVLISTVDSISSGLMCLWSSTRSSTRGAPETRFFVSGSMICNSTSTPTVGPGDPLKWMRI